VFAAFAENGFLLLGEAASLLPLLIGDRLVGLALPLIAEALKEHQRQDVVFIVLPSGFPPKDVGGAPEVGFELLEGQPFRRHSEGTIRSVKHRLFQSLRAGSRTIYIPADAGVPLIA
jgi:hypothetical protein